MGVERHDAALQQRQVEDGYGVKEDSDEHRKTDAIECLHFI